MERASSSGIPSQRTSNSSQPMEEGRLKLVASKEGRLCLEVPGGNPEARARQGGTGGLQQPVCATIPKPKQPHMPCVSVRIHLD
jgi:hypothetical protein